MPLSECRPEPSSPDHDPIAGPNRPARSPDQRLAHNHYTRSAVINHVGRNRSFD